MINRVMIAAIPTDSPAEHPTGRVRVLPGRARAGFFSRWVIILVMGFLAISTFEGALRFYAARAGLPWIIYIKDILLIAALALGGINLCLTNLRNLPFLVVS